MIATFDEIVKIGGSTQLLNLMQEQTSDIVSTARLLVGTIVLIKHCLTLTVACNNPPGHTFESP